MTKPDRGLPGGGARSRPPGRTCAARLLVLALLAAGPASAAELRLLIMEPEIDGDTSPTGPAAWNDRLDLLEAFVSQAVAERDVYEVADPADAARSFEKHRQRADVHACAPCATESAREAGADRTLAVTVFRMSHLVLSMQAILRDGRSGEVRYARSYSFRGDNERAWLHAAERMVRGLEDIPPDLR